jgi:hypothetical protein
MRLGGSAAGAIGADDALLGDGTLGDHVRGAEGVEDGRCLTDHLDKDRRPPLDAVHGKAAVILRQPVDDDPILGPMRSGLVKELDVQLGLTNMHDGGAAVVVLRDAMRLQFEH